jgi:hypothetical protein
MKANEAPEKIYVSNYSSGLTYNWHNERLAVNDIEYIRTDTFIEKAIEWLKENKYHPFIGCEDPCLSGYLTDEFIEDFRKTMEE